MSVVQPDELMDLLREKERPVGPHAHRQGIQQALSQPAGGTQILPLPPLAQQERFEVP